MISGSNPQKSSGWTLLHQAVFVGASCEQIERLVEFGALRKTYFYLLRLFSTHDCPLNLL